MPHSNLVQCLLRGLDILELVAAADNGLTLQELSKRMSLKPPTVFNLARTLSSRGFLEKIGSPPRYRLGPAVLELAGSQVNKSLLRRAPDSLKKLHAAVGGSAVLAQARAGEVMKILRVSPDRSGGIAYPMAEPMPPYTTASALLYQALWSEEERAAYARRYPFWEYGALHWQSEKRLADTIREIRGKGYAAVSLDKVGVFTAAAPVLGKGNQLMAAIGATLPLAAASAARQRTLIRAVLRAAESLSSPEDA
ncbi:MAG: IclR family transcriptional regulator [Phycisphaerae bacterium]